MKELEKLLSGVGRKTAEGKKTAFYQNVGVTGAASIGVKK